jgi:hypothetical protein
MSARAVVLTNFDSFNLKGTVLVQTNNTVSGSTTKYNVVKLKVTNKEMLKFIESEFNTNFPAGAKLAVDEFFSGDFYVLDKAGNEIRYVGSDTSVTNSYRLYFDYANYVYTGSKTASKETDNYTTIGELYFSDALHHNYFDAFGLATVKDSYPSSGHDSESYKLTGAGNGLILGDFDTVVSGTVSGSGKNAD